LVLESGLVAPLVLDITVAVSVPVMADPRQRGAGHAFQLVHEAGVPGPRSVSSRRIRKSGVESAEP
jgi:hypothetical protein